MLKRPTILAAVGAFATAVALMIAIILAPGAQATSTGATAPIAPTDTAPPGVPTGLTISVNCSLQVTLRWNASTDDVGVTGYDIYRGNPGSPFTSAGTSTTTTFSERLTATQYEVRARDAAGNVSAFTAPVNAVPPPCPTSPPPSTGADRQPPTVPGTPTSVATCGVATLTWAASTDNVGVTGYEVWRASGTSTGAAFLLAATTATTSYTHNGVGAYQFEVRARDAAGNQSAFTPPITVYVPACPQSPPPSTPAAENCTATYSAVNSWSGGFQGLVTVANTGSNPTTSWTVTLTFPNGQKITQIWGGRTTSTTSPYVVTNESYNGVLAPGASTTFGFIGTSSGSAGVATAMCTRTP